MGGWSLLRGFWMFFSGKDFAKKLLKVWWWPQKIFGRWLWTTASNCESERYLCFSTPKKTKTPVIECDQQTESAKEVYLRSPVSIVTLYSFQKRLTVPYPRFLLLPKCFGSGNITMIFFSVIALEEAKMPGIKLRGSLSFTGKMSNEKSGPATLVD